MHNLGENKRINKIWSVIKGFDIIGGVITFIYFIAGIVNNYQSLFRNKNTILFLIFIAIVVIVIIISLFINNTRIRKDELIISIKKKEKSHLYDLKYPFIFRAISRIMIAFCLLLILFGTILYSDYINKLESKTIILLTNLDTIEQESRWSLTGEIQSTLQSNLVKYPNIQIIRIKDRITDTEDSGSGAARDLGKQYFADIVIWGEYDVNISRTKAIINIENLGHSIHLPLQALKTYSVESDVENINTFSLQAEIGDNLSGLILFVAGMSLYEADDYKNANILMSESIKYTEWINNDPGRDVVLFYLANTYLSLSEDEQAFELFMSVIELNPGRMEPYLNITYLLAKQGLYQEALDGYNIIINSLTEPIPSEMADVFNNRGNVYSLLHYHYLALLDYDKAILLDPMKPSYHTNRCNNYVELKKYKEAFIDCNSAVRLSPNNPLYYFNRSVVYYHLERYDREIWDLNRAITFNPNYKEAYVNRGLTYYLLKNYEKAIEDLLKASNYFPEEADHYLKIGQSFLHLEKFDQAKEYFTLAIEHDSNNKEAYLGRGRALYHLHELEPAIFDLTNAIIIDNGFVDAYYYRGYAYYDLGKYEEAIKDFTFVLTHDPEPDCIPCLFFKRARAYRNINNYLKAKEDAEEVLRRCGNDLILCKEASQFLNEITIIINIYNPK